MKIWAPRYTSVTKARGRLCNERPKSLAWSLAYGHVDDCQGSGIMLMNRGDSEQKKVKSNGVAGF